MKEFRNFCVLSGSGSNVLAWRKKQTGVNRYGCSTHQFCFNFCFYRNGSLPVPNFIFWGEHFPTSPMHRERKQLPRRATPLSETKYFSSFMHCEYFVTMCAVYLWIRSWLERDRQRREWRRTLPAEQPETCFETSPLNTTCSCTLAYIPTRPGDD